MDGARSIRCLLSWSSLDESDPPKLGYTCDGREGERGVDASGQQQIVCTTVVGKRGDLQMRWAADEVRTTTTTAMPLEVDAALGTAIASADRVITGTGRRDLPPLRSACEQLENIAGQAGPSQAARLEAARFCLRELDTTSATKPLSLVLPGVRDRLQSVR